MAPKDTMAETRDAPVSTSSRKAAPKPTPAKPP
eukprot:CAMPEP_0197441428 /NCGR_PEP_ID=MMETSP1175-20131217/7702_1 /TAXON_ID=1003142 /ORGANISM="Triceratium dubium, Strain CCMP147" /LENGTH=32 /DNA_ID= /DNA_START= /DNA_END= /DNA_ORIENTATION=